MKLYYSPGACSLSPHIVLREAGRRFDLERVDLRSHRTASGVDYLTVNPKGYVPALQLDGPGSPILTEGPAIVQYIADLAPDARLVPPSGTFARYTCRNGSASSRPSCTSSSRRCSIRRSRAPRWSPSTCGARSVAGCSTCRTCSTTAHS
jgi:hypothetical protein